MGKLSKIGIFGGTFNPIHRGHLQIAEEIRRCFSLDSIIFVPAGMPPHKTKGAIIDPIHRLRMVELAVASYAYFSVSPVEAKCKTISYSVETIKIFKKEFGEDVELYFIVGLDAFLEINTWKDVEELLTLCNFIVIQRPGYKFSDIKKLNISLAKNIKEEDLLKLDMGEVERLSIPLTDCYNLFFAIIKPCEISATEIRKLLKEGREVKNLLPESVRLYIMKNKLYR